MCAPKRPTRLPFLGTPAAGGGLSEHAEPRTARRQPPLAGLSAPHRRRLRPVESPLWTFHGANAVLPLEMLHAFAGGTGPAYSCGHKFLTPFLRHRRLVIDVK